MTPDEAIADIRRAAAGHSVIRDVDALPSGHIRIQTALEYIDGSSIDVFLASQAEIKAAVLTDFGNTVNWLLDAGVKPTATKRRQAFMRRSLEQFGAEQRGGAFEVRVPSLVALPDGVLRLAQACMRISDMVLNTRLRLPTAFNEKVVEVFEEGDLQYEENAPLAGRLGKNVVVDYLVQGARTRSAVLTWASGTPHGAHARACEVLSRWVDLRDRDEQRVTIYDDEKNVFKEDDIERLSEFSMIIPASDRNLVREVVAA